VLDTDTALAIDVVGDLVTNASLAGRDIEGERAVILEEIAMNDDDASDVVHDLFMATHYGDTPLGRPILGSQETIESLTPRGIRSFYRRRYEPSRMVVAVAGNIEHARIVDLVRRSFGDDAATVEPSAGQRQSSARTPGLGNTRVQSRPLEQANVVLGLPGVARTDERRYAVGVMNAALGGGMSSRLFQQVREERGLAYSVYSFASQFRDTGYVGVYAGCLPGKVDDVVGVARDVLADVASHGLTAEEVARGRGQLRGSLVLGQEDTGARMSRIGKGELLYGEIPSIDDVLARVDAVGVDDVAALARDLLDAPATIAVIGPFDEDRTF
jgi:predicted Zn-dependent peptidase